MNKVISLESAKILQDVMPDETEYFFYLNGDTFKLAPKNETNYWSNYIQYRTLSLEEAIDLLPKQTYINIYNLHTYIITVGSMYLDTFDDTQFTGETLLEAVEQALIYLHKEGLLNK